MSQYKKGAILSYLTIILTNVIGLLLTPFIIKSLGDAEYGLYNLIGAFVAYISIFDFGLNNSIVRFIAKYRAQGDKKGEENFLAIVMILYGIIAILISLIGIVLFINFEVLFSKSLTSIEIDKGKIMLLILIFNLAISLPGGAFGAICSGYEHFVFPRKVNIARYIIRSIMVVGLLTLGGDSIGLVIVDTIMNLLVILLNAFYVFKILKIKFKLYNFRKNLIKEIFSYSIWIFVYAIVQMFRWQSGQVILGITVNTTTVAIFALGVMLGTYYGAFASAINGLILPKATQMVVKNESGKVLTEMMIRVGRSVLFVLGLVLIGFLILGQEFIYLWVGNTYKDSWLIAFLIMSVSTIPLTQGFGTSVLEASNKIKIKVILNFITISIGVVTGFYVSQKHGALGMIICIVSASIVNSIITNIYFIKVFDFNFLNFIKKTYSKFTIVIVLIFLIGKGLNIWFPNYDWLTFILKGTLIAIIYIGLTYLIALNKEEKQTIFYRLKKN